MEPYDSGAGSAAGAGHLRASDADREQVINELKAAFVEGRLTKVEFDARVSQTLAARTYAELAMVTADIPARPAVIHLVCDFVTHCRQFQEFLPRDHLFSRVGELPILGRFFA